MIKSGYSTITTAKWESDIVLDYPFTLEVTNSHVNMPSTRVYGNRLSSAIADQTFTFLIQTRDKRQSEIQGWWSR